MRTPPWQREFTRQPKALIPCKIVDLGLIDYNRALRIQQEILSQRIAGFFKDTLILCEHLPVFTLGRMGRMENILADEKALAERGLQVISTNRGGDITFHGPGQLVAYPVFDLTEQQKDLRFFLERLEQVAIDFLEYFGLQASRKQRFTGAWFRGEKIASIGIGVKKWVSFHGLAINVNTDLEYFSLIKPCGLNVRVTSLKEINHCEINMELAKKILIEKFQEVFGLKIEASCQKGVSENYG